jgi:hypothetical protein
MDYYKWFLFMPGKDSASSFYISVKPVTNKEYILYLSWTEKIYRNYPEVLFSALPGSRKPYDTGQYGTPFSDSVSFKKLLENSEPFVRDFIFNPEYLNYPVIGISWEQANKFCHWLSDRYNEYCLIKVKHLLEDPNQMSDNSFSSESFIFRQYEGLVGKPYSFEYTKAWSGFGDLKYILRPSFHLPTGDELKQCAGMKLPTVTKGLYSDFNSYSTEGSEFLKPFYKYYLQEHKGYIYIDPDPYSKTNKSYYLLSGNSAGKMTLPEKITEWCLDSYLTVEARSVSKIYRDYGYDPVILRELTVTDNIYPFPQKDSLGFMSVIITGENRDGQFDLVKAPVSLSNAKETGMPYIFDDKTNTIINRNGDIFTCFRVAVNAIKK